MHHLDLINKIPLTSIATTSNNKSNINEIKHLLHLVNYGIDVHRIGGGNITLTSYQRTKNFKKLLNTLLKNNCASAHLDITNFLKKELNNLPPLSTKTSTIQDYEKRLENLTKIFWKLFQLEKEI